MQKISESSPWKTGTHLVSLSGGFAIQRQASSFIKEKNDFAVGIVYIFEMLVALINTCFSMQKKKTLPNRLEMNFGHPPGWLVLITLYFIHLN
jgi:hypothetical protein